MARQIVVDIIGDKSKFSKTLDATSGEAKGWGDKVAGAMKVAVLAVAAVGVAVAAAGVMVFKAGSAMEAMDAKAKTVFGEEIDLVSEWAKANAAAMGLTAREATGLAADFADLLIPMGFTRKAAAEMSTQVVGLSGALSEWSGGTVSASEVADILAKAMLGETDGLKALGISISAADIKGRLLLKGQEDLTGAALEQAEAMAVQELVMEKSTDAQAAYAAGTAVGIRKQHEMEAKLNEVKETLITALYPVLVTVATFIGDNLPAAIKTAGDIFNWLKDNVLPPITTAFDTVYDSVEGMIALFTGGTMWEDNPLYAFKDLLRTVGDVAKETFDKVVAAIQWGKANWDIVFPALAAIILTVVVPAFVAWAVAAGAAAIATVIALLPVFLVIAAVGLAVAGLAWAWKYHSGEIIATASKIGEAWASFWQRVQKIFSDVGEAWAKFWQDVQAAPGRIWDGIVGGIVAGIKGAMNAVIDIINSAIRGINKIQVHIAFGPIKYDFNGLNLGYIPRLHTGGIVPGVPGSDVLTMLQAGERVSPAGSPGGGGTIININIASFVGSDRDIDLFADRLAMRLRLQGV